MTTGRINQVCQMLLRYMQPHGTMGHMAQQQKCICSQLTKQCLNTSNASARRTHNLTPASFTLAPSSMTMLKHKPPAHTQKAACHQAVAQYPESFNDHKETHWQAPSRNCHCNNAGSIGSSMLDRKHEQP